MVNFWPSDHGAPGRSSKAAQRNPVVGALLGIFLLAGCASDNMSPTEINDPLEPVNRALHGVNKAVDTVALRPASKLYGAVTPEPVQGMVTNGSSNLGLPGDAVNHLLQGDPGASVRTVGRFVFNSTVGIAGLLDPATAIGIPHEDTDFGETLYIWGVGEGPYLEVPVRGPSTLRASVGQLVDLGLDPFQIFVSGDAAQAIDTVQVLDVVNQRHIFKAVIDPTYYDSADSYAAARIGYLQFRRQQLKGAIDVDDLEDPFAFDE